MRKISLCGLSTALVLVALFSPVRAQVTAGAISGYVLGPDNRPIPHAELVISDPNGFSWKAASDESGLYRFTGLPPAMYKITASAGAFETRAIKDLGISVDARVRLDIVLQIAQQRTSIDVTTAASVLSTDSAERGSVRDRKAIEALPLNRRDFLQLALLSPGVAPPVQGSELSSNGRFSMHVRGGREEFNNFLLDGADNNDQYTNSYSVQPSVDAIQEFKIVTGTYSAEYGNNAGGQVNVITRSGNNDWHASAYSYLRNRVLDARNFFDGSEKPHFNRTQSGIGVGGPIQHNHTFFYGSYDGLWERRGLTRLATVPTLEDRSSIPRSQASRIGLEITKLFPLPNLPGVAGNYLAQPVLRDNSSQVNGRVDHHLTERDLLTGRYSYGNQDLFEPFGSGSSDVPGFGDYVSNIGHNGMIHYQRILSATALNSLRLGINRSFRHIRPESNGTNVGQLWGVSWLDPNPRDFGYPEINVSGYSPVGDQTVLPIERHTDTYQLSEAFSLVSGKHALRLGGEVRKIRMKGALDYFGRGSLTFSGAITGSGISDLLLGYPSFGIQAKYDNPQDLRSTAYAAYAQDDWKPVRSLTLNFGLRYEITVPPVDPNDRMSTFDPATNKITNVGTKGVPRAGMRADRNNLAPRVGFAWNPSEDLVVRGGYGIYYTGGMLVVNSSLYFNPPYFNVHVFFPTETSLLTLDNPFPQVGGLALPPSPNTFSPDLVAGYLQDWSFGVDRNFAGFGKVELSYSGSKGTHLLRSRDLNQPTPGPGEVGFRRPLPNFDGIFFTESGANSNYHSLQVALQRRFARGIGFQLAYTLSKSIDDASAFLGTQADKNFPQNSRDIRSERSLSSYDVRHRMTASWVYSIPGRNALTRGFELRGILTAQTGQPFTPNLRFDNSNTGNSGGAFGLDRPDVTGDPTLPNPGPDKWFNTSAFRIPDPYHFGSAGRNVLTGPGLVSVDIAVSRRFALTERLSLTADVQAFNLANHAPFDLPERYADQPATFGRIFSAKAPRQIQCALRLSF